MSTRSLVQAIAFGCAVSLSQAAQLEEVAQFPTQQVTGVGVSQSGRVFVCFPFWSDDHSISVAEIVDGTSKAFPNDEWNRQGEAGSHFVCVQSVVVDDQDNLWILDPAAPKTKEIVKGGPKLVKVDLKTNQVVQTIPFGEDVAPAKSYLNDVRIDTDAKTAYITESGKGALVVVDLASGKARRLLDGHKSTQVEKELKITVDGKQLLDEEKKTTPQFAADGIALDAENGYLYYHALTGRTLYRIKTADLRNRDLSPGDLESKVETLGQTPPADGMLEAADGSIYLTDIEANGINLWDAAAKQIKQVITDKRLLWPDTLSWGPKGELYVTSSQIENMPKYNSGKSTRTEPYPCSK